MTETPMSIDRVTLLSRGRRGLARYGWQALCREALLRSARPALAPIAARQLRTAGRDLNSIDEVLDLVFDFAPFGIAIRPLQSRWEFHRLLEQVEQLRPERMLEIGTATGGSLLAFTRVCAPDAHVMSVDLPGGAFGGGYPTWKLPLYKAFAAPHQRLDLIRRDSHSPETLADVRSRLHGKALDFLFIDGDHTFAGVQQDFESYSALVRPGGLIAFHDIAPPNAGSAAVDDPGDVPAFWQGLQGQYQTEEFVLPGGPGCFGIGLLRT
jgi:predicted O-methyltransferase YrrM